MSLIWRCQCPEQCDDGESCWSDVTQEDARCDWCRANCARITRNRESAGEQLTLAG